MNIPALRKLVADAYVVTDNLTPIPRFSTQFVFADNEVLVRIPVYECQPPPIPLLGLICNLINTALPNLKLKADAFRQDLLAAAEGKQIPGRELDIRGITVSTSSSEGSAIHAVTECRVLIRNP